MQRGRSDESERNPFKREILTGLDDNGFEIRIFREQFDLSTGSLKAFDGHIIINACHYDLAVAGFSRLFDGEQITVQNTGIAHTHPFDFEKVIGTLAEQVGIDCEFLFDVF